MLACLHNLSKQASKAQCFREGQGQNTRKKPHFNPKVSVWHKTITVASRTGRIFFLKSVCEGRRTRSKNISSSRENGTSVYFFIFLISNFLAKFNNKLENLVEFTLVQYFPNLFFKPKIAKFCQNKKHWIWHFPIKYSTFCGSVSGRCIIPQNPPQYEHFEKRFKKMLA